MLDITTTARRFTEIRLAIEFLGITIATEMYGIRLVCIARATREGRPSTTQLRPLYGVARPGR